MCILRNVSQNRPVNTEYDVCDPALCVLEVVVLSGTQSLSSFFMEMGTEEGTRLTGSKSKARCSAKGGSIWASICHRCRAGCLRFGREKESAKSPLFSSARAAGDWLGGSAGTTSGSRTDAEIGCD